MVSSNLPLKLYKFGSYQSILWDQIPESQKMPTEDFLEIYFLTCRTHSSSTRRAVLKLRVMEQFAIFCLGVKDPIWDHRCQDSWVKHQNRELGGREKMALFETGKRGHWIKQFKNHWIRITIFPLLYSWGRKCIIFFKKNASAFLCFWGALQNQLSLVSLLRFSSYFN